MYKISIIILKYNVKKYLSDLIYYYKQRNEGKKLNRFFSIV